MIAKKIDYPKSYRGIRLKWIDNKPKYKKGDKIIIYENDKFIEIILEKATKHKMKLTWLNACWGCRKPNPLKCDMFVYRWNDGLFSESDQIKIKSLKSELLEVNKDVKLYNQIKASLEGEILQDE